MIANIRKFLSAFCGPLFIRSFLPLPASIDLRRQILLVPDQVIKLAISPEAQVERALPFGLELKHISMDIIDSPEIAHALVEPEKHDDLSNDKQGIF